MSNEDPGFHFYTAFVNRLRAEIAEIKAKRDEYAARYGLANNGYMTDGGIYAGFGEGIWRREQMIAHADRLVNEL